jgi:hypothetical protein
LLSQTGCAGAFCSTDSCSDGGVWFLLAGPGGEALADHGFELELETEKGSAVAGCSGGSYGPEGECVDQVIFFPNATGTVAIGELALDADSGGAVLAVQVFERVANEGGDHVRGPETLTVRVRGAGGDLLLEESITPTYSRTGSSRCGECDRVDETPRFEVDLDLMPGD